MKWRIKDVVNWNRTDISSAPLQSKSHLLLALPSCAVQLVWDLPTLDASKPGESLHGDRELIRIYHTPWFHHWFTQTPFVSFESFFTGRISQRCVFHITSATFMLPQSFTNWHVFFCGTSRAFQQKQMGPVRTTNPGLLSKMTLLQTSQAVWNPQSTLLRIRLRVSELSQWYEYCNSR